MEHTQHFKEKLEAELKVLTEELSKIARVNTDSNKEDWEAKGTSLNLEQADDNERADAMEEYELNNTVLKDLEVRYNNVKAALKRIEEGTYGVCEIGGEPIETARLEANPAATTCTNHIDERN
jgi:RNA polymerase-binding transcription factor DksA